MGNTQKKLRREEKRPQTQNVFNTKGETVAIAKVNSGEPRRQRAVPSFKRLGIARDHRPSSSRSTARNMSRSQVHERGTDRVNPNPPTGRDRRSHADGIEPAKPLPGDRERSRRRRYAWKYQASRPAPPQGCRTTLTRASKAPSLIRDLSERDFLRSKPLTLMKSTHPKAHATTCP